MKNKYDGYPYPPEFYETFRLVNSDYSKAHRFTRDAVGKNTVYCIMLLPDGRQDRWYNPSVVHDRYLEVLKNNAACAFLQWNDRVVKRTLSAEQLGFQTVVV